MRKVCRRVSPLTLRILAVNMLALAILVAGMLYLNRYSEILIEQELEALQAEAQLFANALAEGAVVRLPKQTHALVSELTRPMVFRLSETARNRTRVFNARAELIADSRVLEMTGGLVTSERLPPLGAEGELDFTPMRALEELVDFFPGASARGRLQDMAADDWADPSGLPSLVAALNGEAGADAWLNPTNKEMLLMATAPVQRFKQVLGAVMVTRSGDAIIAAERERKVTILQVFGVSLLVTILLSLYLAGTISGPIRRLASAAQTLSGRHSFADARSAAAAIPDYDRRGDEIGDLSTVLREMTMALYARMDAIERFAADVAHEIKNPLTSLRSAVETAARVKDPEQQKHLMAIILDDVTRLDRLISDISNASRLDAEMSRADMEPVDLAALLDTLVAMQRVAEETEEQPTDITLTMPSSGQLTVSGSESRLYQVFQNLVINAVSFSPPGGSVRLTAERQGRWAVVTVADDGPGIPETKLEAIFDRFYSERPEGEKFGLHSGLGLSISKQIVDAHGGTIEAANRSGSGGEVAGAVFTVRLPLAPA